MKNLYGLFVGINNYANIRPLSCCENDAGRLRDFLEKHVDGIFGFHPQSILGRSATKNGIVKAFREHLVRDDLQEGDVLFFYFSGHGAEEDAHEVFWSSEPNKKLQVLACYDSEIPTSKNFLADKELRYLLHQAAKPGVEIIAMFDCCHSGDNTRSIQPGEIVERLAGQVPRRQWNDFIFSEEISQEDIAERTLEKALPQARHIQFAACDSHESAYESKQTGGFFTTALLEALNQSKGDISYLDLKNKARNIIRGINLHKSYTPQTPQIYSFAGNEEDQAGIGQNEVALFRAFLNGALKDKPIASEVYFNRQEQRWEVDKGAIYGVTEYWEGVPQQVIVPTSENGNSIATIKKVFPGYSVIEFEPYADILPDEIYSGAYVPSLMARNLKFSLTGEREGVSMFLEHAPAQSLLKDGLSLVETTQAPEYNVLAKEGKFLITLPGDDRPLTRQTAGTTMDDVQEVQGHLGKIRLWSFVKNLKSDSTSFPAGAFEITISQDEEVTALNGNEYKVSPNKDMKFRLTNNSGFDLYYGLVFLDSLFGIYNSIMPGKVSWIENLKPFETTFGVKQESYIQEFNWEKEQCYFLIIASHSEFSIDLFDQEALEDPRKGITRSLQTRSIRKLTEDWQTHLVTLTIPNSEI